MTKKIGFLLSAGGSACFEGIALAGLAKDKAVVITDRVCGASKSAESHGFRVFHAQGSAQTQLSQSVLDIARQNNLSCIVMLFSRLVGPPLLGQIPVLNIHPSLLPAFPGLDGVSPAANARMPFQGATLHVADAGMDTGPILAQALSAVRTTAGVETRQSIAFALKSTLVALAIDWWKTGIDFSSDLDTIRQKLPTPIESVSAVSPRFFDKEIETRCLKLIETRFDAGVL